MHPRSDFCRNQTGRYPSTNCPLVRVDINSRLLLSPGASSRGAGQKPFSALALLPSPSLDSTGTQCSGVLLPRGLVVQQRPRWTRRSGKANLSGCPLCMAIQTSTHCSSNTHHRQACQDHSITQRTPRYLIHRTISTLQGIPLSQRHQRMKSYSQGDQRRCQRRFPVGDRHSTGGRTFIHAPHRCSAIPTHTSG